MLYLIIILFCVQFVVFKNLKDLTKRTEDNSNALKTQAILNASSDNIFILQREINQEVVKFVNDAHNRLSKLENNSSFYDIKESDN